MITRMKRTSTNPLLDSLQQAWRKSGGKAKWLVIAHDDDRLVNSLASAFVEESACVLTIRQGEWDFRHDELAEVMEWAVRQDSLKHLVVVGHSEAESAPQEIRSIRSGIDASGSYDRLRQGVRQNVLQTRDSRLQFAQRVNELVSLSGLSEAAETPQLSVHGLFFLADSALFLYYDAAQREFLPMTW